MISKKRLYKIQKSIVNEEKLIGKDSKIIKLPEKICNNINCYAYVLGIMQTFPYFSGLYNPGFTTSEITDFSSIDNFLNKVSEDLSNLNIKYRKFNIYDEIILDNNEYLIQVLYIPKSMEYYKSGSFHFSRKSKDGLWFSKMGWLYQPSFEKVDIIKKYNEYEHVNVKSDYCNVEYLRIGYFAISKKDI